MELDGGLFVSAVTIQELGLNPFKGYITVNFKGMEQQTVVKEGKDEIRWGDTFKFPTPVKFSLASSLHLTDPVYFKLWSSSGDVVATGETQLPAFTPGKVLTLEVAMTSGAILQFEAVILVGSSIADTSLPSMAPPSTTSPRSRSPSVVPSPQNQSRPFQRAQTMPPLRRAVDSPGHTPSRGYSFPVESLLPRRQSKDQLSFTRDTSQKDPIVLDVHDNEAEGSMESLAQSQSIDSKGEETATAPKRGSIDSKGEETATAPKRELSFTRDTSQKDPIVLDVHDNEAEGSMVSLVQSQDEDSISEEVPAADGASRRISLIKAGVEAEPVEVPIPSGDDDSGGGTQVASYRAMDRQASLTPRPPGKKRFSFTKDGNQPDPVDVDEEEEEDGDGEVEAAVVVVKQDSAALRKSSIRSTSSQKDPAPLEAEGDTDPLMRSQSIDSKGEITPKLKRSVSISEEAPIEVGSSRRISFIKSGVEVEPVEVPIPSGDEIGGGPQVVSYRAMDRQASETPRPLCKKRFSFTKDGNQPDPVDVEEEEDGDGEVEAAVVVVKQDDAAGSLRKSSIRSDSSQRNATLVEVEDSPDPLMQCQSLDSTESDITPKRKGRVSISEEVPGPAGPSRRISFIKAGVEAEPVEVPMPSGDDDSGGGPQVASYRAMDRQASETPRPVSKKRFSFTKDGNQPDPVAVEEEEEEDGDGEVEAAVIVVKQDSAAGSLRKSSIRSEGSQREPIPVETESGLDPLVQSQSLDSTESDITPKRKGRVSISEEVIGEAGSSRRISFIKAGVEAEPVEVPIPSGDDDNGGGPQVVSYRAMDRQASETPRPLSKKRFSFTKDGNQPDPVDVDEGVGEDEKVETEVGEDDAASSIRKGRISTSEEVPVPVGPSRRISFIKAGVEAEPVEVPIPSGDEIGGGPQVASYRAMDRQASGTPRLLTKKCFSFTKDGNQPDPVAVGDDDDADMDAHFKKEAEAFSRQIVQPAVRQMVEEAVASLCKFNITRDTTQPDPTVVPEEDDDDWSMEMSPRTKAAVTKEIVEPMVCTLVERAAEYTSKLVAAGRLPDFEVLPVEPSFLGTPEEAAAITEEIVAPAIRLMVEKASAVLQSKLKLTHDSRQPDPIEVPIMDDDAVTKKVEELAAGIMRPAVQHLLEETAAALCTQIKLTFDSTQPDPLVLPGPHDAPSFSSVQTTRMAEGQAMSPRRQISCTWDATLPDFLELHDPESPIRSSATPPRKFSDSTHAIESLEEMMANWSPEQTRELYTALSSEGATSDDSPDQEKTWATQVLSKLSVACGDRRLYDLWMKVMSSVLKEAKQPPAEVTTAIATVTPVQEDKGYTEHLQYLESQADQLIRSVAMDIELERRRGNAVQQELHLLRQQPSKDLMDCLRNQVDAEKGRAAHLSAHLNALREHRDDQCNMVMTELLLEKSHAAEAPNSLSGVLQSKVQVLDSMHTELLSEISHVQLVERHLTTLQSTDYMALEKSSGDVMRDRMVADRALEVERCRVEQLQAVVRDLEARQLVQADEEIENLRLFMDEEVKRNVELRCKVEQLTQELKLREMRIQDLEQHQPSSAYISEVHILRARLEEEMKRNLDLHREAELLQKEMIGRQEAHARHIKDLEMELQRRSPSPFVHTVISPIDISMRNATPSSSYSPQQVTTPQHVVPHRCRLTSCRLCNSASPSPNVDSSQ